MLFYVAWTRRDPIYPNFDPNCSMLISAASVPRRWRLIDYPKMPTRLIIDSGSFRYATLGEKPPSSKELFERQMEILDGVTADVTICALDSPILDSTADSNGRDRMITQTLANAYEFRRLTDTYRDDRLNYMPVVQGYDTPSLRHCAHELRGLGFKYFGIGSLALLSNPDEVLRRVDAVVSIVGTNAHIFGVTGARTMSRLKALGITSIDSTTPAKSAMYNEVFYSEPFRRFVIEGDRTHKDVQRSNVLHKVLDCNCPICSHGAADDLLKVGSTRFIHARTIHNYYRLKEMIMSA